MIAELFGGPDDGRRLHVDLDQHGQWPDTIRTLNRYLPAGPIEPARFVDVATYRHTIGPRYHHDPKADPNLPA